MSFSMQMNALRRFKKRFFEAPDLGIRPTDLVLDLASGQDPHPRANVLCDKFAADSGERACGAELVVDRPFVMADATATPFPDKAFDFVFCCHLLEHMEQPESLFLELQRISKRGYIETPSKVDEKLWGWSFHRWFVSIENGKKIVMEEKNTTVFDEDMHRWFGKHMEEDPFWSFFMKRLESLELLSILVWDEEIVYEVHRHGNSTTFDQATGPIGEMGDLRFPELTSPQKLKSALSWFLRRSSDRRLDSVLGNLVCPACRVPLRRSSTHWDCSECETSFPIMNGAHVLLRPQFAGTAAK